MASSGGWSIQPDDWANLRSALKGADWTSTWLDILYQDSVPESEGIYMICVSPRSLVDAYNLPSELSAVLYVGKSSNLRQRFKQHASTRRRPNLIYRYHSLFRRLKFAYTLVDGSLRTSTAQWASHAEHSLIMALDPPANQNIPSATPLIGRIGQPRPVA